MKMDIISIANKATAEQDFFIAILKNPSLGLAKFNIETSEQDLQNLTTAMDGVREKIISTLTNLGGDSTKGSWGLGGICCNGKV